jgi:hypothetical protein
MKTTIRTLIAATLFLTVLPATTLAQNDALPYLVIETPGGEALPAVHLQLEPGDSATVPLRLATTAGVEATLRLANVASPPNGGIALQPATSELAAPTTWLQLDTGPVTLATGAPVSRSLEVSVPEDAAPGQYVAAVALETSEPIETAGSDLPQLARASTIVTITVPGEFDPEFTLGEPTLIASGSLRIQVPLTNTGTLPVAPSGTLTLAPAGDGSTISFPVTMGIILAGSETSLDITLSELPPPGEYEFDLTLTDSATRTTARTRPVTVTIPEVEAPLATPRTYDGETTASTIAIRNAHLEPQGSPIESALVTAEVANTGSPVHSVALILEVSHNGQVVDTLTIVEIATLTDGSVTLGTTYTPEGGFGSGLWTFRLRVETIGDGDPTVLAETGTIAKLDVP